MIDRRSSRVVFDDGSYNKSAIMHRARNYLAKGRRTTHGRPRTWGECLALSWLEARSKRAAMQTSVHQSTYRYFDRRAVRHEVHACI